MISLIASKAKEFPSAEAIIWHGRSISWEQLYSYIRSTSRQLKELSITKGSCVAIAADNSVQYIILLYALWELKAVACPLHMGLPSESLANIIQRIKARFLFIDDTRDASHCAETAQKVLGGALKIVNLGNTAAFDFSDNFWDQKDTNSSPADPKILAEAYDHDALILITSGSSGHPKLVVHSIKSLYLNALGSNEIIPFNPGDQWLLSLPLYHVSGISILFRSISGGGAVSVGDRRALIKTINSLTPTHLSLVPAQLKRVLPEMPVGLKAVLLGGSPIPLTLRQEAARKGLPLYITYGMTEAGSQIATGRVLPDGSSIVKPLSGREISISEEGEILVRGVVMFSRYVTTDTFSSAHGTSNQISVENYREIWFQTGDLGIIKDNSLTVLGRKDNMFISGGENIYPEAIERAILEHPDVEAAQVVPIPHPEYGCVAAAFVLSSSAHLSAKNLKEFLSVRLARHEIPKEFLKWPEQLRNVFKINRAVLIQKITTGNVTSLE